MAGGHTRTLEEGWHGEEVEGPRPKRNEIWAVYLKRGGDRFEIQMPMLVSWKGWKEEIGGRQGKKGCCKIQTESQIEICKSQITTKKMIKEK